ncbi:MAG: WecB/TagA/CpsF family glycosyltransferase [Elusimicrobia bacterium]|nr:WecB/TagA/CpsF family glycosyltransferase [Elusimicrobiota bacterium]MBU2615440.1 WecB/TagA/CpsF family glycosyltransferase [Elusimicrobiota bacterium]
MHKTADRIYIGKIPVDLLSWESILSRIDSFIQNKKPTQIVTFNSLMYNFSCRDQELENSIVNAGLVLPDSIGIAALIYLLSGKQYQKPRRKPGIDLMLKICEMAALHSWKIFLLGSKPEIVKITVEKLKTRFPGINIAGFHDGFFKPQQEVNIFNEIRQSNAAIVFVGLDVPRQEKWIFENLRNINIPIIMGVGGSFDVISGKLKRAPGWMQALGLEWFYRFAQEPWRITRIKDLPVFALKALNLIFQKHL